MQGNHQMRVVYIRCISTVFTNPTSIHQNTFAGSLAAIPWALIQLHMLTHLRFALDPAKEHVF